MTKDMHEALGLVPATIDSHKAKDEPCPASGSTIQVSAWLVGTIIKGKVTMQCPNFTGDKPHLTTATPIK